MNTYSTNADTMDDTELVVRSLAGDRGAFAAIVKRYQGLVCSLAYSATGSLTRSEDISQETFLAAWKRLPELREPGKLRSWLCGIARNLNYRALRARLREPLHAAAPLEDAQDSPEYGAIPRDRVISSEEESILWRSLENIPENYREPLILFYREHQSVERVAHELDLSEEVVRQRLSRGRRLLRDEVAVFVEGALRKSAPGARFSASVAAALPLDARLAAGAGVAKAGGLASLLSIPLAGLLASAAGTLGVIRDARTPDERRFKRRVMAAMWADCAGLVAALTIVETMRANLGWHGPVFTTAMVGCYLVWALIMAPLVISSGKASIQFFLAAPKEGSLTSETSGKLRIIATVCAMTAGALTTLIYYAWRAADAVSVDLLVSTGAVVVGWVSVCLFFPGALAKIRLPVSFLAWIPTLLVVAAALLSVNWRLDLWIAAIRGTNLADAQFFLPMWTVHGATLLLLVWIGILARLTTPRPMGTGLEPQDRRT